MPDVRKPLETLRAEWEHCTKCVLGVQRQERGGAFVFGEGRKGGIMFIGEGPGRNEEESGHPFVGRSGQLLRGIIRLMALPEYYITNIVTCRSCNPEMDDSNNPKMTWKDGVKVPLLKDEPPLPVCVAACRPRLMEEIYLVDPVIIVALGGAAADALAGHKMTITSERGNTFLAKVPGHLEVPALTGKKRVWLRTVGGAPALPTKTHELEYLVMPTLHPAFVCRREWDKGERSPRAALLTDIWQAVKIYERCRRLQGYEPLLHQLVDEEYDTLFSTEGL